MELTLVLLAGGFGTRFGGLKQLYKFGKQRATLTEFAIFDALRAGFTKFVAVVNDETRCYMQEMFEKNGLCNSSVCVKQDNNDIPVQIDAIKNRQKPLGTGHALWCVRNFVKTPFVVINADDFYGFTAYKLAVNFFKKETKDFCLIGYNICNTLSSNGYVSRGLCEVNNGIVVNIKECKNIKLVDNDIIGFVKDKEIKLNPNTTVSMNFWALNLNIFGKLEKIFMQFIDHQDIMLSEFFLPEALFNASKLIKNNIHCIHNEEDNWIGITYAKDVDDVERHLKMLTNAGVYPNKLYN